MIRNAASSGKVKIFLMLSGGVDSSVAALLLKKKFDLHCVYFKKFKADGDRTVCKSDAMSAKKVAQSFNLPFEIWDFQDKYKNKVFDYFIESYRSCKTPNPDIVCNREIKFGVFAQKAFKEGANLIASGHYARLVTEFKFLFFKFYIPKDWADTLGLKYKKVFLKEAKDKNKDQSYFLSQVKPELLKSLVFPLGSLKKKDVKKIAQKAGLHTAGRKESQGLCFVGKKINVKDLLKRHLDLREGYAFDLRGRKIAIHTGAQIYTVGERRGFQLLPDAQSPYSESLYLIRKDCKENELTLGNKEDFERENAEISFLKLKRVNYFDKPKTYETYKVRIRHRGAKTKAVVLRADKQSLLLELKEPVHAPSLGQFVVIYSKDKRVLASGEISEILKGEV